MDEIIITLIDAIAANSQIIKELENNLSLAIEEAKNNQEEITKLRDTFNKQIEDLTIYTQKLINKAIQSITIPTAEVIDYKAIKDMIIANTPKVINGVDGINGLNGTNGTNGLDGKDAIVDYEAIKDFIKTIPKPKDGKNGLSIKGEDGVGIEDITLKDEILTIELTNGVKKKFKLPKAKAQFVGGGTIIQKEEANFQYLELESLFKNAALTNYKELTYIDGNITTIEVWENDAKMTKFFTKNITYSNGNITKIDITDNITGKVMNRTVGYDLSYNIVNITTQII
jgi:hypothetical protein